MKVTVVKTKTVSASTAAALDEQVESAKAQIKQQNDEAQFVDFKLAASQGDIYATIVWTG